MCTLKNLQLSPIFVAKFVALLCVIYRAMRSNLKATAISIDFAPASVVRERRHSCYGFAVVWFDENFRACFMLFIIVCFSP